mmetsp:Transcript_24307/g.71556  ORF Transcript_24307/g.71556 Transcript_24307/m.71556 type:complete len:406 (+) Transcript_24307:560-1777(+)
MRVRGRSLRTSIWQRPFTSTGRAAKSTRGGAAGAAAAAVARSTVAPVSYSRTTSKSTAESDSPRGPTGALATPRLDATAEDSSEPPRTPAPCADADAGTPAPPAAMYSTSTMKRRRCVTTGTPSSRYWGRRQARRPGPASEPCNVLCADTSPPLVAAAQRPKPGGKAACAGAATGLTAGVSVSQKESSSPVAEEARLLRLARGGRRKPVAPACPPPGVEAGPPWCGAAQPSAPPWQDEPRRMRGGLGAADGVITTARGAQLPAAAPLGDSGTHSAKQSRRPESNSRMESSPEDVAMLLRVPRSPRFVYWAFPCSAPGRLSQSMVPSGGDALGLARLPAVTSGGDSGWWPTPLPASSAGHDAMICGGRVKDSSRKVLSRKSGSRARSASRNAWRVPRSTSSPFDTP